MITVTQNSVEEKAINYQLRMNKYLAKRQYTLAYKAFLRMNIAREREGIELLTMPNLQARFEN